jgi:hypothetical protein
MTVGADERSTRAVEIWMESELHARNIDPSIVSVRMIAVHSGSEYSKADQDE